MKRALLKLFRFYQTSVSPLFPPRCRYIPTCSEYAVEAVEKYGAAKGGLLALRRLMRCHPFHKGMTLSPDATASFFPSHYKTEVSTPCLHKSAITSACRLRG